MPNLRDISIVLIASGIMLCAPLSSQAKGGGGHGGGGHAAASGTAHAQSGRGESNVGGNASGYNQAKAAIAAQKERQEHEHARRYGHGGGRGRGYWPYDDDETANQQSRNSLDTYNQSQDSQRAALPTSAFVQVYSWPKSSASTQVTQNVGNSVAPAQTASSKF